MRKILPTIAMAILVAMPTQAQRKKKKNDKESDKTEWKVSDPGAGFNYQTHRFTTDEGTWMNLDVSPDGKTIVFDLLGDIYSIPMEGGTAKVLASGIPYQLQPRFSPDGSKILFTSDEGGGDNLWTMNADGSDPKQITKEQFRLLNNGVWTPDGQYLIARKHFTSGRSLGAGEMWQYHISGGSGLQITKRKNDQQDVNEPFVSPDGRYLYYSEDMYPGGFFQYNKDPNDQIYVIKRYDMQTGKTITVTGGPGGAARPTLSRDGTKLAYIRRVRTKSVLYIHDLETGQDKPLFDGLSKDQQEAWAIFGVYPNFNWTPDDQHIVIWAEGKIHKITVSDGSVSEIPFTANVAIDIAESLHVEHEVPTSSFTPKVIRQSVSSPDGNTLVFHAVGYLWKKSMPNGTPTRLTNGTDFEYEPTFSPDGSRITYVSWNDKERGKLMQVSAQGGTPVEISREKATYRTPSYSPDGRWIVFRKESGNMDQGFSFTKQPGVYLIPATGGEAKFVSEQGEYPVFTADGKRIFLKTGGTYFGNITKKLISVNLDGKDEREHISSKYANWLVPSPDNKWIAFTNLHKVYVAPLTLTGKSVSLDDKSKSVPVSQLAGDAGIGIHWSADSKKVMWTLGDQLYSSALKDRFTFLPGSPEKVEQPTLQGTSIGLQVSVDKPQSRIALTNVRAITMEDDQVMENATILIEGNMIKAIGQRIGIPDGYTIYDLSGKTVMPGLVDAHAHIGAFRYGLGTQTNWQFLANLAFGVTTAHDPSANTETVFGLSELVKAGEVVGPRLYSTGFILYGADGDFKAVINSLDDARSHIRRTKAFGATSVKSYNQPRREQRQQVMQAARELGVNVVPEGGSTFFHNMSMIVDGHTGIEHNIPVAPVYKDVIELWKTSGTGYTPTLIVNYGGLNGEYYFYERDNVWENEKLLRFTPRRVIDSRSRHRTKAPQGEYTNGHILVSKTAKTLTDAGVKVNMGAHGQLQGLGAHWETWMMAQGGMTNMEALKTATINAAEYIGIGKSVGSIKSGKLADLIVLTDNPLEDIENTQTIEMVMANGRLYDANTMNEMGKAERLPLWWEIEGYNQAFPWHEASNGFMRAGCGCHIGHQ